MPTNDDHNAPKTTGSYDSAKGDIGSYPNPGAESAKLGYETTDVNVRGVLVFVGGLFGFVIIFFAFCFLMGKVINTGLDKQDGAANKWHHQSPTFAGAKATGGKREDLKSNAAMEQQELQTMTSSFPGPQLQTDDGNQATADLHAREDLLLNNYSSVPGQPGIRIPIDQAMKEIVAKGLPVQAADKAGTVMAYDQAPAMSAPLTSGFARTGYELETIEAREQKIDYGKASGEAATHAKLEQPR